MADREMTSQEAIEILCGIRACFNFFNVYDEPKYVALTKAIFALKAEPKHAYAIVDEDGNMKCSNGESGNCFDNYCGHCGAKLIGERKESDIYCDRNLCAQNEYNGIGCNECQQMRKDEVKE